VLFFLSFIIADFYDYLAGWGSWPQRVQTEVRANGGLRLEAHSKSPSNQSQVASRNHFAFA